MNFVLLVGAGFSHNWNGWLAEEIMGDVLGRVADDQELSTLLNQTGNFEDALSEVQAQYRNQGSPAAKVKLDRLQEAILDAFRAMNQAFADLPGMEFSDQRDMSIQAFLWKFDAIFTLNQDLLFELHYNPELHDPRRGNGYYFPGMQRPPNWWGASIQDRLNAVWHPMYELRTEENLQPIYKLHGSMNWRDRDGGELLVMGANKQRIIREKQILTWYSDEFRRYLEIPDTRLMVIGYGFRDDHIDAIMHQAWQRSGFRMFLVNPQGRAVLNKSPLAAIRVPNPLEAIQLIGDSLRQLLSTFGNDRLEHGKFMRFFGG